jgi:hypothetical protein
MIIISSCSHVEYLSGHEMSVSWTPQHTAKPLQLFISEQKIHFYFFGLAPSVNRIFVDEIAQEEGFASVSRLTLYERPTVNDILLSVLTLGLYTPRTVTLQGMGEKF